MNAPTLSPLTAAMEKTMTFSPSQFQFLNQCAMAMNAYRQLTNDKTYASRVEQGKMQLVRVRYDAKGKSTVEECSDWIPCCKWLAFMDELCAC